jgi:hypothetical protein
VTIYRMEVWGKEVVPTSLESSSSSWCMMQERQATVRFMHVKVV